MGTPIRINTEWTFVSPFGPQSEGHPLRLAGDRIVGTYGNQIFAIEIYEGRAALPALPGRPVGLLYQGKTPGNLTIGIGGGFIFFVDEGKLQAVATLDGAAKNGWEGAVVEGDVMSIEVTRDFIGIVTNNWDDVEYSTYDRNTGIRLDGPVSIAGTSPGKIAAGKDAVFFVSDQQLHAINLYKGDRRFPKSNGMGIAFDKHDLSADVAPLVCKETVLGMGDRIYACDLRTGESRWCFPSPDTVVEQGSCWRGTVSEDLSTVVVTCSDGQVCKLDATTGKVLWRSSRKYPSAVMPTIAGRTVYLTCTEKLVYTCSNETGVDGDAYELDHANSTAPLIGNGTFFFQTTDGNIHAVAYGEQNAAFLNGVDSYVQVPADKDTYDVGGETFSVEAWIKSSKGGEILSSFPTAAKDSAGFRFHLDSVGQLCFGVFAADYRDSDMTKSYPSEAADGCWHHVAAVRMPNRTVLYLDGVAMNSTSLQIRDEKPLDQVGGTQLQAPRPADALAVTGENALAIGAYRGRDPGTKNFVVMDHFLGLLREVRLWSCGLDAAKIASRMRRELKPETPGLIGYWPLDEHFDASAGASRVIKNLANNQEATFVNPESTVTDLLIDDSVFPYLLNPEKLSWPYATSWSSRGSHAVKPGQQPALSSRAGIVAFSTGDTGNAIYGIHKMDGRRQWSHETPEGCSPVIASGDKLYVLTGQERVVEIDSLSGKIAQVAALSQLLTEDDLKGEGALLAPLVSDGYLAAASPSGKVGVVKLAEVNGQSRSVELGEMIAAIRCEGGKLFCLTQAVAGLWSLHMGTMTNLAALKDEPLRLSSDRFCIDGNWLAVVEGDRIVVYDVAETRKKVATSAPLDVKRISALACTKERNTLVVASSDGTVRGLSLATLGESWTRRLPGQAQERTVHEPLIDGVYAYLTDTAGVVAVLDIRDGSLRGYYQETNPITTAPTLDSHTLYYGCADGQTDEATDGALHSVVIGATPALRLGLDDQGRRSGAPEYASIVNDDPNHRLEVLDIEQTCIEAWIRTTRPGEVVSMAPSGSLSLGLRLFLDAAGALHFEIHESRDKQSWSHIHASTGASNLCDGGWHHVAASCKARDDVRLYIDGMPHDVSLQNRTTAKDPTGPNTLIQIGRNVLAGAEAEANYFCGFIAEVRIWDTYLVASEIGDRMHTQLRGNEPDLLAYWHFDASSVHDYSRDNLNGELVGGRYWLTDLPFDKPAYPYLTSTARVLRTGDAQAGGALAETLYELTVRVSRADGAPLAAQAVDAWYVRYHSDEPSAIFVNGTEIAGVSADHEFESNHAATVTDSCGNAKFIVSTKGLQHGPSFDVRASFMPTNERFHVNVLIDNQQLAQPAPPTLAIQSKLIQDYRYVPGCTLDSTRARPTYRTNLVAKNADGSGRAGEIIEVWAEKQLTIEVGGQAYRLTPENSQRFHADGNGEVCIVIEAEGINVPELIVYAGFMHRDDRMRINVAGNTHADIAGLSGKDMVQSRMKNWRSAKEGGPEARPLLNKDYQVHSNEIAGALSHSMSAVVSTPPAASNNALGAAFPLEDRFEDLGTPIRERHADSITPVRTLVSINRTRALTADFAKASLHAACPGALGMVVTNVVVNDGENGVGVNISYVSDPCVMAVVMQGPERVTSPDDHALGGFFGDLWDAVSHPIDTLKSLAEKAASIAIEIGKSVTLAISTFEGSFRLVLRTVADVCEAVGAFLAKIALTMWDFVQFLLFLFDWSAILETHSILKRLLKDGARKTANALLRKDLGPVMRSCIADLKGQLGGGQPALSLPVATREAAERSTRTEDGKDKGYGALSGVGGKMMTQKVCENASQVRLLAPANDTADLGKGLPGVPSHTSLSSVQAIITGFFNGQSFDPNGFVGPASQIVKCLDEGIVSSISSLGGALADGLIAAIDHADAAIHIPFLSELYEWITGSTLTILDVVCLALAVPTNIGYAVFTELTEGELRHFNKDAALIAGDFSPSTALGAALEKPYPDILETRELVLWNFMYSACTVSYVGLASIVGASTIALYSSSPMASDEVRGKGVLKIFLSLFKAGRTAIFRWKLYPNYSDMVKREIEIPHEDDRADLANAETRYYEVISWLLVASAGISFLTGSYALKQAGLYGSVEMPNDPSEYSTMDCAEFFVFLCLMQLAFALDLYRIAYAGKNDSTYAKGNDKARAIVGTMISRDVVDSVDLMCGLFQTKIAQNFFLGVTLPGTTNMLALALLWAVFGLESS